ncbi:MAG: hypothetical protein M5R36_14795 [Deltaproteobacteria bacterium]|nr:hypothetical protein [Deltaproteobacteria bacterium]
MRRGYLTTMLNPRRLYRLFRVFPNKRDLFFYLPVFWVSKMLRARTGGRSNPGGLFPMKSAAAAGS